MPSDTAAIIVACTAGAVSLATAGGTAWAGHRLSRRQAEQAESLQEAKLRADAANARYAAEAAMRTQEARLRAELRTEFMAEEAIRLLLEHEDWTLRSFDEIKRRVRGFDDDELRRLLVRSGAVAFERTRGGDEMWGLRERNQARLRRNTQ